VDGARVARPLFQTEGDGSTPISTLQSGNLLFGRCGKRMAVDLCRRWHSRLPNTQIGPWEFAFSAEHGGIVYAVALWNNPSARTLPNHWIELRRMACAPDAPKHTASRFLAWMVRWFKRHCQDRERCISYQDTAVHAGTMYRAAGWEAAWTTKARERDRSKNRSGTNRAYRTNLNGLAPDVSEKVRWEKRIGRRPEIGTRGSSLGTPQRTAHAPSGPIVTLLGEERRS
jgi:hypothetical protein